MIALLVVAELLSHAGLLRKIQSKRSKWDTAAAPALAEEHMIRQMWRDLIASRLVDSLTVGTNAVKASSWWRDKSSYGARGCYVGSSSPSTGSTEGDSSPSPSPSEHA